MAPFDALERGRAAYENRAWSDAYTFLTLADRAGGLSSDDLQLLGLSALLTGRDDEFCALLERAHLLDLEAGEPLRAFRCAFWIGFRLAGRGESGRAGGWFGRAKRLLEQAPDDCVEHGYMLVPAAHGSLAAGDFAAACRAAAQAVAIGTRYRDADLLAFALHLQGRALLGLGRVEDGLALLDEAMVSVAADELSPQLTGLIYCSMIGACRRVYALGRAHEWTSALAGWCAQQPDLVPFSGQCLVYRAELLLLHGEWDEALAEARRAADRSARAGEQPALAAAHYQQGEVHRLRGDFAAAEQAYAEASRCGLEPQPGLALLRLAQGRASPAAAAIHRSAAEAQDAFRRTSLLPACIEVLLAAGDTASARAACAELEALACGQETNVLGTIVAQMAGAVALAEGDVLGALGRLRRAWHGWQELDARYDAARVRVLLGLACRRIGDSDTAALEFRAAAETFAQLGAAPDLSRLRGLVGEGRTTAPKGLTPRELEVLALLATGMTNRAIAEQLRISDRTVARHVSNIFGKLGVSSRAAATAYAHRFELTGAPA